MFIRLPSNFSHCSFRYWAVAIACQPLASDLKLIKYQYSLRSQVSKIPVVNTYNLRSQLITNLRWKIVACRFNYKPPDRNIISFRLEFASLHELRSHMTGRAFCSYAIFYMLWLFFMMGFLLLLIVANIFLRSNRSFILIQLNTIGRSSLGEAARSWDKTILRIISFMHNTVRTRSRFPSFTKKIEGQKCRKISLDPSKVSLFILMWDF